MVVTGLLFAVQLSVNLATASSVTAAGFHATRQVASRAVDHDDPSAVASAQRSAEAELRRSLGQAGAGAVVDWDLSPDRVRLTVTVSTGRVAPAAVARPVGLDTVTRTFDIRIERDR